MKRKEIFIIIAILIAAFFWRMGFLFQLKNNYIFNLYPGSDSLNYDLWAKRIIQQGLFYTSPFYGMPLYAFFLAFIYKTISLNLWVVRIIQMILGALNCLLIYLIGKKFFNDKIGFLSSIIAASYVMLIFYEVILMPVTLIIFLNSILILSFLELMERSVKRNFIFFGVIAGVAGLAEPGIFLFIIGLILALFFCLKNKTKTEVAFLSFILMVGMCLILSLNIWRNYAFQKDLILVSAHSGINFYIGNNPQASGYGDIPLFLRPSQKGHLEDAKLIAQEKLKRRLLPSEVSRFWFKQGLNFIKNQPKVFLKLSLKKLFIFWQRFEPVDSVEFTFLEGNNLFLFLMLNSFGLISPLCLLGMFLAFKKFRQLFILYLLIFSQMLAAVLFFVTARYRLAVVPVMIVFCAYCLYWFYLKLKQNQFSKLSFGFLIFIGLFMITNYKSPNYQGSSFFSAFNKHYNLGIVNLQNGSFVNAIKELKSAIKISPQDYLAHFALANSYYSAKNFDLAIKEYKAAIFLNPRFIDAHFNLGHLYQNMSRFNEAEEEYHEVLNLAPDSLDALYKLAALYKSEGKFKQAIEHFEIIQAIDPYYSSAVKPLIDECIRLESGQHKK